MNLFLTQRNLPNGKSHFVNFSIKSRTFLTSIALLMLLSFQTYGQNQEENHIASVSSEFLIVLDITSSLAEKYIADISELNFDSEEAATSIFDQFEIPALKIDVMWESQTIEIKIIGDPIHVDFTVADWNQYFLDKSKHLDK